MLLSAPPNPTKTKYVAYIAATVVLGIFFSALTQYIIEYILLIASDLPYLHIRSYDWSIHGIFYGSMLHPVIQISILSLGVFGGFFIGRHWWRLVYVERKWAKGILK